MKKLLIILLLIVGCEGVIEPVDNSIRGYVNDSQGNAMSDAAIRLDYILYYEPTLKRSMTLINMICRFLKN